MPYAKDNGLASTNNDLPPIQLRPRAAEQVCCRAEDSRYSEHTQPEQRHAKLGIFKRMEIYLPDQGEDVLQHG